MGISYFFNSLIASFITITPFLAFAYQQKVDYFCSQYWFKDLVIKLDPKFNFSSNDVLMRIRNLLEKKSSYETHIANTLPLLKSKAISDKSLVLNAIEEKRRTR